MGMLQIINYNLNIKVNLKDFNSWIAEKTRQVLQQGESYCCQDKRVVKSMSIALLLNSLDFR